jgi:transposase InsO family protein
MAHTIQYESRTVELPAILLMELDDDVLEVWDQPPSFIINYKDAAGRNRGHFYTADFFVLRQHSAGWEEWKTEEQLANLAVKNSEKYCLGGDHRWRFPPGERHADTFGLYFHVHSSAELDLTQLQNLKLLLPYFAGPERGQDNQLAHDTILSTAAAEPGITMAELLTRAAGVHSHDVFRLIISRQVYVDLRRAWLGDEQQVQIYRDKEAADFLTLLGEIRNQTPEIGVSTGHDKRHGANITQELETKEEMAEAMRRWEIIKPALRGEPITDRTVTTRTHRNWIASFRRAAASDGNGLLGLIPRHRHKGNSTDRLALMDERLRPLMIECINEVYETPVKKTKSLVYGELARRCESIGLTPPTYKTFNQAIKRRADAAQMAKMEGRKVSYQHEEFIELSHVKLPVHGDRPWEFAHIDHTELDVELRHSTKHILMGKAWLTLLIDSFSRRVLAYYLTFDPPSYRSCMGAIRECVRLFNRLPECLVADNGAEFHSVYFEKLLARYQCDIQWRPPTSPRFGAIIERFIHTLNQQFIHNLMGNTKIMKKARQVTSEVDPKKLAVWTLPLLDDHLMAYFCEEYDTRMHVGLGCSPREEFQRGLEQFDLPQPYIAYDERFLIDTLPTTKKGSAKVTPSRGIKVNEIFYQSPRLRRPELYGQQVEVRYDPFNMAHVYALVGKEWIVCYAPPAIYAKLKVCTEREVKIFSEERRQLTRAHGRGFRSRAKNLAERHILREESERVQQQRLRDAELRIIRERHGKTLDVKRCEASPHPDDLENRDFVDPPTDSVDLSSLVSFRRTKRRTP